MFLAFVLYPVSYGLWLARHPESYARLFADPIFVRTAINTVVFLLVAVNLKFLLALWLSGFFVHERVWIRWLSVVFLLPWAVPSIPTIFSIRFMFNPEWGVVNSVIFRLTAQDGPNWLNDPHIGLGLAMLTHIWKSLPFWTLILMAGRLAIPREQYEAAAVGGAWQKFKYVTWPSLRTLSQLDHPLDDLVARRLQQRLPAHRRRAGRPHARARHARHPLHPPRPGRPRDGDDRGARCRSCCRWSIT